MPRCATGCRYPSRQVGDELVGGRVQPVTGEEHLDLQSAEEALARGVVW